MLTDREGVVLHVAIEQLVGPGRGLGVVIYSEESEFTDARVVLRLRASQIKMLEPSDFRGRHFRCSWCSMTWDAGAREIHNGRCVLAPFGVADQSMYEAVEGEVVNPGEQ